MSDYTHGTTTPNSGTSPPRLALRPKEAAKALGIGERLLWSKTNAGEIPHVRLGKCVVYPIRELQDWLTKQAADGRRPESP